MSRDSGGILSLVFLRHLVFDHFGCFFVDIYFNLQFSEIAFLFFLNFHFPRSSECSLFDKVAANRSLCRDATVSSEPTDFKLKAIARNADPWNRRLRSTILGIESRP